MTELKVKIRSTSFSLNILNGARGSISLHPFPLIPSTGAGGGVEERRERRDRLMREGGVMDPLPTIDRRVYMGIVSASELLS